MSIKNVYSRSENGNIMCIGLRNKNNGDIIEIPKEGNNVKALELIGQTVVFYNVKEDIYYDINILKETNRRPFRFEVEYEGHVTEVVYGDFILGCHISKAVKLDRNKIIKRDGFYSLFINIRNSNYRDYFDKDELEVLFDGDEETVAKIKNSRWHLAKTKNADNFYITTASYNKEGKRKRLHKVIFGEVKKGNAVDHILRDEGNWLDNRKSNLREVTPLENSRNKIRAGFPKKREENGQWYYYFTVNGIRLQTPQRDNYEQADIDSLIAQKHFNFLHRESEYFKLEEVDKVYQNNLIEYLENKLQEFLNKDVKLIPNKFIELEDCIKIFGKNEFEYTYISKEDKYLIEKVKIRKTGSDYWNVIANRNQILLSRYVLGINVLNELDIVVDHIDRDIGNNKRDNLVITTIRGNAINKNGAGYQKTNTGRFKVKYNSYWNYIKNHNDICKTKQKCFETENEARVENLKRRYLSFYIRPQFKTYQDYLIFKEEYELNNTNNLSIDDYWITTRFPDINSIKIPKFDIDKL